MIKNILDLLELAKGETENIRVAKGKYHLPTSLIGAGKKIKKEAKWQNK
jgi:hypothetical protein